MKIWTFYCQTKVGELITEVQGRDLTSPPTKLTDEEYLKY